MNSTVEYVYCVVPAALELGALPAGIDGTAVRLVVSGGLAALAGSLNGTAYTSETIAEMVGDPEWLSPRAIAHDAVITWTCDRGPVIPLPMWVLFADVAGITRILVDREHEFVEALAHVRGAQEFCVRIAADRTALAAAAEQMDVTLADLEERARVAAPGEAYLIGRKLQEARKAGFRNAAARIAEDSHHALSRESRSTVVRATPAANDGAILDGAYLVANENYDQFRTILTGLMATYEPAGVQFHFTGPWPPYHFVRES